MTKLRIHAEPGQLELTVLLPCLNEERTIGACVTEARQAIAELGLAAEVLVADNGSEDDSRQVAQAAGARVVKVAARGYGSALRAGIAAARGRYLVIAAGAGRSDCGQHRLL